VKVQPIEPILRENLIRVAKAFANARGVTIRYVSTLSHGDGPFFERLMRAEGSFTVRKYDECMAWFKENWPQGIEWPKPNHPVGRREKRANNLQGTRRRRNDGSAARVGSKASKATRVSAGDPV